MKNYGTALRICNPEALSADLQSVILYFQSE